jgi:hypothetical protein
MPRNAETTQEKPRPSLKQRAVKAGATAMTFAALGGVISPAAKAEHSTAAGKREAAKSKLRDPHELPGLRTHLGQETLNKIKNSTIEVGYRPKANPSFAESGGNWQPNCTGVKVSLPGQKDPFIMTAAHCFGNITGAYYGVFKDTHNPKNRAENFTALSPVDFAILDPDEIDLNQRMSQPVAIIDGISIDTDNKDVALLHPVPQLKSPIDSITSQGIRNFADIPAIPLSVAEKAPVQGTPVALYGEPQAGNFEPIAGTGVYLGRVWYDTPKSPGSGSDSTVRRQLDLVGINPPTPDKDNCNYGTSGSMALLPNGKLLGNLTLRTSHGYGADKRMQPPDSQDFDSFVRPQWELALNVKFDSFDTICGYTVMDASTPRELVDGFNHPAVVLSGKGGDPNAQK